MSGPPELQNELSPHWWVRLCLWLCERQKFVWSVLIVGTIVGVGVNWLTSSTSIFTGTPLGAGLLWARDHLLLAGFIGLCLLFLNLFVSAVSHLASASTRVSSASDLQQSRGALIRLLHREYHRQITKSLQGATMMALTLQQRTDVVRSSVSLVSWRIDESEETFLPAPVSIVQAYDDAGGGLLILGTPGAGKSTLLLELATELLIRAGQDPAQPVPVIVNLSSWAISKLPLTAWLVDQLQLVYAVPRHLGQVWIEQGHLLLLLDGLDEVVSSARSNGIEAINAYRAEHFVPLVVCSRIREYLEQEARLRLPIAVEVRPLTPEQVDGYLKGAGKPLAAVRAALRSNAALGDLVTTPLMLSVVMLAYRGKTLKELPKLGSIEQQQRQVFEHYVTRMLKQQTRKWHYTSQQTRKWLSWLAQRMQQRQLTEFYLERLQPDWLPDGRLQQIYESFAVQFLGVVIGVLVTILVFKLLGDYDFVSIIIGGLIGGLFSGKNEGEWSIGRKKSSWRNIVCHLADSLGNGLFAGLTIGFSIIVIDNPSHRLEVWMLQNGLGYGLSYGLSFTLLCIFFKRKLARLRTTMAIYSGKNIRHYLINAGHLGNGLLIGILVGLGGILGIALSEGMRYSLMSGLWRALGYGPFQLDNGLNFTIVGILLSILLIGKEKTIQPAEIIAWSWRGLMNVAYLRSGFVIGGLIAFTSVLSLELSWGLRFGFDFILSNGLIKQFVGADMFRILLSVGLGSWLLIGLFFGMSSSTLDERDHLVPNQAIRRSARNGIVTGFISGLVGGIITILTYLIGSVLAAMIGSETSLGPNYITLSNMPNELNYILLNYVLSIGVAGGLFVGLLNGGAAYLRHYYLRYLLWRSGAMPRHYVRFLEEATERILLQRVGSGYRFIHPLFQDYFASLETGTSASSQLSPSSSQS